MVTELTNDNFREEIKEGKVLLDIYATWCGPCKALAPILEEMSEEFKGIKFCKADAEEADEISTEFRVRNLPTLVFIKDGKMMNKIVGAPNRASLEQSLIEMFS